MFADSGGSVKFGRCVCLFKHFLGVHVKKACCKFSTYFWAFSKGPGQHVAHMRSLARVFAQRVKVYIVNTLKRVWNCPNVWCVSANSERSAKAAQMFALIWNYRPWAMSLFVSTYHMCIQYWLKPAYVYVQSCKSIYCLHIVYLSHVYPVLTQTSLRICAILQEHSLLAHSVLISCVSSIDSNKPTHMCNNARAFTTCT